MFFLRISLEAREKFSFTKIFLWYILFEVPRKSTRRSWQLKTDEMVREMAMGGEGEGKGGIQSLMKYLPGQGKFEGNTGKDHLGHGDGEMKREQGVNQKNVGEMGIKRILKWNRINYENVLVFE